MSDLSTLDGSLKFSKEAENEIIKLAGLLEGDEWEAVRYYLKGLQSDVNDDVIQRIVKYSKSYNEKSLTREKASY